MADKINFTVAALQAIQCPVDADRVYVYDTKAPRLAFCRTAGGSSSFYLYYRSTGIDRRPKRYLIGHFPQVSIDIARNEAMKLNGEIAKGNDPQATRKAGRASMTFGMLFKEYMGKHSKPMKRTWQDDQDIYDRHLACWENRKASTITRDEVRTLHVKIGEGGKYAANRTLALLSAVFNFGEDMGIEKNPARRVKRFPETKRKRFLQPDEMPRFFAALKAEPDEMMRDFFSILLITGARRSNVCGMRWDNLNLESAVWIVPAADAKGGEEMPITLHRAAVDILLRRRDDQQAAHATKIGEGEIEADAPLTPWVFPSYGTTGHLMEPKAAWGALLDRAGIADLRLHDLRRTFGSWQAIANASQYIIGASLGHKDPATTAVYARLNLAPVAASVNTAVDAMLAASKAKPVKSRQLPAA